MRWHAKAALKSAARACPCPKGSVGILSLESVVPRSPPEVYLRQQAHNATGEHSAILLRPLSSLEACVTQMG